MYIPPSGTITLYSGIPLRDDYEHTFSFPDANTQSNYFLTRTLFTLSDQQYTRKQIGRVRVAKNIYNLQTVDYLSFCNSNVFSHNARTYYCFVTNIEYVNENASDLVFSIDVIQTYMFDLTYKPSYIERMHVSIFEDGLLKRGDIPFPVIDQHVNCPIFSYHQEIFGNETYPDALGGPMVYVVAATFDTNFDNASGGLQNGFYSGLHFNIFNDVTALNTFIYNAADRNKADGIVSIFMAPAAFASNANQGPVNLDIPQSVFEARYTANNYVPKNGMLYTSPFCAIVATDNDGSAAEYQTQRFTVITDNNMRLYRLKITYVCAGYNEISIYPCYYDDIQDNYNEQIILNVTPQCAYATDSYRAWLAQNASKMYVERNYALEMQSLQNHQLITNAKFDVANSAISGISGIAGAAASSNSLAGAVVSVAGKTASTLTTMGQITYNALQNQKILNANTNRSISLLNAEESVARTVPPQAHGAASGMAGTVNGAYRISIYTRVPAKEWAQKIDDYFEMYGYEIDMLREVQVKTRKYWNYIKCAQFNGEGTRIPGDDYDTIKMIYERGITFWHDTSHFLDYSQNNHQSYSE